MDQNQLLILNALLNKPSGQEFVQTNKLIDQMGINYTPGLRESKNVVHAPPFDPNVNQKPVQTMDQAKVYNRWNPIDQFRWLTNK